MAEGGQVRSKTAHRTKAQSTYARQGGGTEKAKKDRAARNANRADAIKAGRVRKGDGKEVSHKVPVSRGGSARAKPSALTIKSRRANRKQGTKRS